MHINIHRCMVQCKYVLYVRVHIIWFFVAAKNQCLLVRPVIIDLFQSNKKRVFCECYLPVCTCVLKRNSRGWYRIVFVGDFRIFWPLKLVEWQKTIQTHIHIYNQMQGHYFTFRERDKLSKINDQKKLHWILSSAP